MRQGKPIQSMTGYGAGRSQVPGGWVMVEVKSVNHRYLDVGVKCPREYASLEPRLIERVRARVRRGKVDVLISRATDSSGEGAVRVDLELARAYQAALASLGRSLSLADEVTLELLASQRDVILAGGAPPNAAAEGEAVELALSGALDGLASMREREGERLAEDLSRQAQNLAAQVAEAELRAPLAVEEHQARLAERVRKLLGETPLEPSRFVQEVALLAERTDVHEELVRLRSHLAQLEKLLADGGDLGRKLDFLLQEIGREVNTVGSKAGDLALSRQVMEMKSVAERIREQAQNVE